MGKVERCPICDVPVKAENLRRHVEDTHPRHPDAAAVQERIREDTRYVPKAAPRVPLRIRKSYVAILAGVLVVGVGVWAASSYSQTAPFSLDECVPGNAVTYHIHWRLSMFIAGSRFPIPYNIGVSPGCARPVHTHDDYVPTTEPAVIHVEYRNARQFTVGDFFTVWGVPFAPTQLLTCTSDVTMTVNGLANTHYAGHPVVDGDAVELSCGSPTSPA